MRRLAPLLLLVAGLPLACKRAAPAPGLAPASSASSASASVAAPASAPLPGPSAEASASAEGSAEPPPAVPPASASNPAVTHQDVARSVLYAWVTPEQAALLRKDRALIDTLRKSKLPRVAPALRAAKDPTSLQLQRILKDADRTLCGLAWSNPWGAAPTPPSILVKIKLRPDAYLGSFDPKQKKPWRFVDLENREVPAGKVMAHPERLAAIYYVLERPAALRGYALSSEEAIASWSLDTDEIRAELAALPALFSSWKPALPVDDAWPQQVTEQLWPRRLDAPESTLASLETPPLPERWAPLAAGFSSVTRGKSFEVKPSSGGRPFGDLGHRGVHRQVCTEHGDKTRCAPLPPSSRRAYDGRFCVDEEGHMRDCKKR
ncbi:MAG: hypothetical protein MUF64_29335 [Polyangiaceae bacterium]|jgi:hypothetical protein|nr:hypothetical protein [Polyangiaceae bacterium]